MNKHKWRFVKDEWKHKDMPGKKNLWECQICGYQVRYYGSWPFDRDRAFDRAPKYCEQTK